MLNEIIIPKQLHNPDFRFIKLKKQGKEAIEKEWNITNNYAFNNTELQVWIKQGNNYGVCGGFGGLVIIDSDSKDVEEAVKEYLPNTFRVRTAHGMHHYFICKDMEKPIRLTEVQAGDLGDVQFKGKYVVGPGSIHPSGRVYEPEDTTEIVTVNADEIKFALRTFLDIKETEEEKKRETSLLEGEVEIGKVIDLNKLTFRGKEYYGSHPLHGSRGGLNFWVNPSKNVWHCFRHDSGGGPLSWVAVQEGLIDCSHATTGALKGKIFHEVLKIANEKYGLNIQLKKGNEERFFEGKTFVSKRLAEEIMSNFIFKTLNGDGSIYAYDNGVYKDNGEIVIKEMSTKLLGESCSEHRVNDTIFYIKGSTFIPQDMMNKDKFLINVKNGIYNLENHLFMPHDSNKFFTNQLNINYDVSIDCPKIKKFLSEILQPEDIPVVQEILGYCLYRDYIIHKAFMLVGDGANGKSTLINLMKIFLGQDNISSVSLQDFDNSRFAAAELYGKLANLYADLPDKSMYNTGKFKMLTGNDNVSGEKKFRGRFNFTNYAKLIFSTNKVPKANDDTGAFFRRWSFLNFPNKFEGDKCNPNILKELTTEQELSGLFNWVCEGLERLLKNGKFSSSKSTDDIKDQYERMASPVIAFAKDWLNEEPTNTITKDMMYAKYVEYCKLKNLPPGASNSFAMEIKGYFGEQIRVTRPEIDGRRQQCWEGVIFNENALTSLTKNIKKEVSVNPVNPVKVFSSLISYGESNNIKDRKSIDIIDSIDGTNENTSDNEDVEE